MVWFTACWMFAAGRDGMSALSLHRTLGIGSYPMAWAMLYRLRSVLVSPGRERLTGMSSSPRGQLAEERAAWVITWAILASGVQKTRTPAERGLHLDPAGPALRAARRAEASASCSQAVTFTASTSIQDSAVLADSR
jgi:hypothetical protein